MNAIAAASVELKGKSKVGVRSSALSKKSKQKVIELYLSGGKAAKQQGHTQRQRNEEYVVQYRLKARKLARSILRKWRAHLELQEVDSLVDLSLCEAVRRYNPRKGASFMTFLYYHLKGNLIRAVSTAASQNAVPVDDDGRQPPKRQAHLSLHQCDRGGRGSVQQ